MNLLIKGNADYVNKTVDNIMSHADCAKLLLDNGENFTNMALYHLSVLVKIMLKILCKNHNLRYTNYVSIEDLFDKTYKFLPKNILDMANDICYWHGDLQYVYERLMTVNEGMSAAREVQDFYNGTILSYLEKLRGTKESSVSTLVKF